MPSGMPHMPTTRSPPPAIDRVRGERGLAAAAHAREERALGGDCARVGVVVDRARGRCRVTHASPSRVSIAEHALRDRRDAELERQQLRDAVGEAEPRAGRRRRARSRRTRRRRACARRVGTLPRSIAICRSGRRASSWHWRRMLEVPTVAPCGSVVERAPARARTARPTEPRASRPRRARGRARARPARPSSSGPRGRRAASRSACSISFTNRPLPPTFASGTSRILSPEVLMTSKLDGDARRDRLRAAP